MIEEFINNGFVKIEDAFPRELTDAGREILWRDTGCDPHDPSSWTQPVIRLNDYAQEPFRQAVNTPRLHAAYDKLVGRGRWQRRDSLGTWPVRFPSDVDPGDAGWHAEASFAGDDGSWRLNVNSRGRALLMLFLFSDVGDNDAPTRIQIGSHFDVARALEPAGEAGMSFIELAQEVLTLPERPITYATGAAGTVYLCHPFLFHAAQLHRGTVPRFMAQPPLLPAEPIQLTRADCAYSPVEIAIRLALGHQ
jgi:Phytanoyl-CoA dioxygenase (PhyH)